MTRILFSRLVCDVEEHLCPYLPAVVPHSPSCSMTSYDKNDIYVQKVEEKELLSFMA